MALFQRIRNYVLTETAPARATWGMQRYLKQDYAGAAKLLKSALADRPGMARQPLLQAYAILSRIRTGEEGLVADLDAVLESLSGSQGRDSQLQDIAVSEIKSLMADHEP